MDFIIVDGLIGVVGFNGCGKFNLLEVLCWVMGENCLIVMCGGGMEDVIFVGVVMWFVCNFVEVVLMIDNSEWFVFVGFNIEDVIEIV